MSGDTGKYREGDRRQENPPGKSTGSSFRRFLRNMGFSQPPTADLNRDIQSKTNEMRTLLASVQENQEGKLGPTQISNFPSPAENTQASLDEIQVVQENSENSTNDVYMRKDFVINNKLENMKKEINVIDRETRHNVEERQDLKYIKRNIWERSRYKNAKEALMRDLSDANKKLEEIRESVRAVAWEKSEKADPMKRYIHACLEKKTSVEDLLKNIRDVKEGISKEDVIYAFGSVNEWYLRNFNDLLEQHKDKFHPRSMMELLEDAQKNFKALMAKALQNPDDRHIRPLAEFAIMLEDQKVKIKDSVIKGAWNSVNSTRSLKALYGDKTDDFVLKLVFPTRRTRWDPKSNAYEPYESGPFEDWS